MVAAEMRSGCHAIRERESAGILPVRCPGQDTSVHEEVQDRFARSRVCGEELLRIGQRQTKRRRVEKGLLHGDDEILNLAASFGNHLFISMSLERLGIATARTFALLANAVPEPQRPLPMRPNGVRSRSCGSQTAAHVCVEPLSRVAPRIFPFERSITRRSIRLPNR